MTDNSSVFGRGPPLSATAVVTITLADENERPVFDNGTLVKAVQENVPANTKVGGIVQVNDVDAGDDVSFKMDHAFFQAVKVEGALAAQITTKQNAQLNFELQSSYVVPISVTDKAGLTSVSSITINLLGRS